MTCEWVGAHHNPVDVVDHIFEEVRSIARLQAFEDTANELGGNCHLISPRQRRVAEKFLVGRLPGLCNKIVSLTSCLYKCRYVVAQRRTVVFRSNAEVFQFIGSVEKLVKG